MRTYAREAIGFVAREAPANRNVIRIQEKRNVTTPSAYETAVRIKFCQVVTFQFGRTLANTNSTKLKGHHLATFDPRGRFIGTGGGDV